MNLEAIRGRVGAWLFPVTVLALAPLLLFPRPRLIWLGILLPAAWITSVAASRRWWNSSPLNPLLFSLSIMVAVSAWATYDIDYSLGKIAGTILGICVFSAILWCCSNEFRTRLLVAAFIAGGAGLAVLSLVGTKWKGRLPGLRSIVAHLPTRFTGLPGAEEGFHANPVGGTMILLLPLLLLLALMPGLKARWRACTFLLLGLHGGILLLSESRGAWLGFACSIALVLVFTSRVARWLALVGTIPVAASFWFLGRAGSWQNLLKLDEISGGGGMVVGRLEVWSRAVYGIQDFPFTGMGMNTFRKIVHVLYPLFSVGPETDIASCHNKLLQTALDVGIPGLIAYFAIVVAVGILLLRVWLGTKNSLHGRVSLGILAGLVGQFVYEITDAIPLGAKVGIFWWIALGIAVCLFRLEFPDFRRRPRSWEILLLWVLISLVSISFVGDHPYLALAIGILGGVYCAWEATRASVQLGEQDRAVPEIRTLPTGPKSGGF